MEEIVFGEPTPSNSRLGSQLMCQVVFDRFTIMGNLDQTMRKKLADELASDENFNVLSAGTDRFKAKSITDTIYIEYDKIQADAFKKRNLRIEFNPQKISDTERILIKTMFLEKMNMIGFTRIDLAFDFEIDLSQFYIFVDSPLKKTIFYGKSGKIETKYFGSRDSDRYIRIYDKKKERLEKADIFIDKEYLWRIEFELKKKYIDKWDECFKDINLIQPAIKSIESIQERAMANLLITDESEWGNLHKNSKKKYKELLVSVSDVNLNDVLKINFEREKKYLQEELNFWLDVN